MPQTNFTLKEIREQSEAIDTVLDDLKEKEDELTKICSKSSVFCLVGCGASYYLALIGNSLLMGEDLSFAFPSSEILVSSERIPNVSFDTILSFSRSGESTETVKATKYMKKREPEAKNIGFTCTEESTIQKNSNISIISRDGKEQSVVMTKSFSSMLVAIEYFSKLNTGENSVFKDFQTLPKNSEKMLKKSEKLAKKITNSEEKLKKFVFLGPGEYYGLASEAMLAIEEMSLSWSKAYHPLEFRHGPRSIVDDETLVTLFTPSRRVSEHKKLLEEVQDLGAKTLAVGKKSDVGDMESSYVLEVESEKENPSLSLYIPIAQFLAYFRAVKLGLDPDNPQNLTKVVKI